MGNSVCANVRASCGVAQGIACRARWRVDPAHGGGQFARRGTDGVGRDWEVVLVYACVHVFVWFVYERSLV